MDLHAREEQLVEQLSARWADFTPYPEYFRLRYNEFRVLRGLLPDLFREGQHEQGLEVGCGFGFQTALLTPYCRQLTAVDIPQEDHDYSPGEGTALDAARRLVNDELCLDVRFDHAWPDNLPVDTDSVDLLYSAYVLEHIPDLYAAWKETARVVREGGAVIHVVPSVDDAVLTFVSANIRPPWRQVTRGLFRRGPHRARLAPTGAIVPPVHSEYARDFGEQIHIYSLEHYLFAAVEHGFTVERILQTRSVNRVLVLRR